MGRYSGDRSSLEVFAKEFDYCWACGIGHKERDREIDFWPRRLEIHHIAKFNRKHGRWNLSRLCSMCHMAAEGESIRIDGVLIPKLKPEHVFWLKHRHDEENYDRTLLGEHWYHLDLPQERRPPSWYEKQYLRLQGHRYP